MKPRETHCPTEHGELDCLLPNLHDGAHYFNNEGQRSMSYGRNMAMLNALLPRMYRDCAESQQVVRDVAAIFATTQAEAESMLKEATTAGDPT